MYRRPHRPSREGRTPYVVDFENVSTVGWTRPPVAEALAGLRANEARYYKNKYDHVFTVRPAGEDGRSLDRVNRILADEREIVIAARPLEATSFEVDGIRMAYVFYESGLSINVMYGIADGVEARGRVQAVRGDGGSRGTGVALQVREAEVQARRGDPRLLLRDQGRVLRPVMLPVSWDTIRLFLHVLAATVWVGGQLVLAALVPVLRKFGTDATRAAARRFNQVAWSAFAVLIVTGIWNIAANSANADHAGYRATLVVKLVVVAISGVTAALHTRSRTSRGRAVFGALTGLSALAALFLGVLLAG